MRSMSADERRGLVEPAELEVRRLAAQDEDPAQHLAVLLNEYDRRGDVIELYAARLQAANGRISALDAQVRREQIRVAELKAGEVYGVRWPGEGEPEEYGSRLEASREIAQWPLMRGVLVRRGPWTDAT